MRGLATRRTSFKLALFLCASLWPASIQAQDAEVAEGEQARELKGTLIFEDIPSALFTDHIHWRIPVAVSRTASALPLEDMQVVLVHPEQHRTSATATLEIASYKIQPRTLTVPPGTTIELVNKDFDVTMIVAGRSKIEGMKLDKENPTARKVLDKPGRYLFRATNYTSVLSYVIVTKSVADSVVTSTAHKEAEFNLGEVSKGSYELRIYFRGTIVLNKKIRVNSAGRSNESRFLITRDVLAKAVP